MLIKSKLILDLKINSVEDLYKLKTFEGNSSIINKSQIAIEVYRMIKDSIPLMMGKLTGRNNLTGSVIT